MALRLFDLRIDSGLGFGRGGGLLYRRIGVAVLTRDRRLAKRSAIRQCGMIGYLDVIFS